MKNYIIQSLCVACVLTCSLSSTAQNKQSKIASYYNYNTECLEDKLDGNFIFMAWGTGSTKKEAIDQAQRNAINDILFKGVIKKEIVY